MQNDISSENARALLQSTQQLRIHWSSVIVNLINYVILLNIGIWTIFGKGYIDSLDCPGHKKPLYIVLASFLSSLSLLLWRLYTHYLDYNITRLYPDFLFYERALNIPSDYGTGRYLKELISKIDHSLPMSELKYRKTLIAELIEKRHSGSRGHWLLDLIAAAFAALLAYVTYKVICFSWLQMIRFPQLSDFNHLIFYIIFRFHLFSILTLLGLSFYQRLPSKRFIKKTLKKLKKG